MERDQTVTLQQLSDSAKQNTVAIFAKFYIREFQHANLEILSSYPVDAEIGELNHFLAMNSSFHPNQLFELLVQDYHAYLYRVLMSLELRFRANGTPSFGDWTNWYEQKYEAVMVEE
ncbi:hypothetical protein LOSG293_300060 [Secundilactobacillus oryzae JCM 18671]|uniref:Uncharacterized protein n=1 Tax=Secundilactobacillus oryzae JCM 18671 TaxID=1291743 RepID=A0A081BK67_9LACO|nr:hypothetical protein [Secundilactobacillus oryzae]GAK48435.1 hypothetical protein LOSG293_300060 [Secundilactobacillus oryzae JCM 18671]